MDHISYLSFSLSILLFFFINCLEKDKAEPFNVTYQQGIADQPSKQLPHPNPIEKPKKVDVDETISSNLPKSREEEQNVQSISDEEKNEKPDILLNKAANEVILEPYVYTGKLEKMEKWFRFINFLLL